MGCPVLEDSNITLTSSIAEGRRVNLNRRLETCIGVLVQVVESLLAQHLQRKYLENDESYE
jgi:hypothetical protein